MENGIVELAEMFKTRENPPTTATFIGTYLDGGIIKLRDNVLLQPGKYINAIPKCTCTHTCSMVNDGGYQASSHKHDINCDHDININVGDRVVVLQTGGEFVAIAKIG